MEAFIVIGSIVAILAAVFWLLLRADEGGQAKGKAAADKRNAETRERERDAVADARRDSRSNVDQLRDNDSKW